MNFLMDRSVANWARHLAGIREQTGECRTDSPVIADGAMAGYFEWECERAELRGYVLLAPTRPATIQQLDFMVLPRQ